MRGTDRNGGDRHRTDPVRCGKADADHGHQLRHDLDPQDQTHVAQRRQQRRDEAADQPERTAEGDQSQQVGGGQPLVAEQHMDDGRGVQGHEQEERPSQGREVAERLPEGFDRILPAPPLLGEMRQQKGPHAAHQQTVEHAVTDWARENSAHRVEGHEARGDQARDVGAALVQQRGAHDEGAEAEHGDSAAWRGPEVRCQWAGGRRRRCRSRAWPATLAQARPAAPSPCAASRMPTPAPTTVPARLIRSRAPKSISRCSVAMMVELSGMIGEADEQDQCRVAHLLAVESPDERAGQRIGRAPATRRLRRWRTERRGYGAARARAAGSGSC